MKVPITAYIMFIVHVLSFVVCSSDCGVSVNQMYMLFYIINTTEKQEIKKNTFKNISGALPIACRD